MQGLRGGSGGGKARFKGKGRHLTQHIAATPGPMRQEEQRVQLRTSITDTERVGLPDGELEP